jgi:hypothetical protein
MARKVKNGAAPGAKKKPSARLGERLAFLLQNDDA